MPGELWGYVSTGFFLICTIPQVLKSYHDGHSDGISWGYLIFLLAALITGSIYALPRDLVPVYLSYITNGLGWIVILYYKLFPRSIK